MICVRCVKVCARSQNVTAELVWGFGMMLGLAFAPVINLTIWVCVLQFSLSGGGTNSKRGKRSCAGSLLLIQLVCWPFFFASHLKDLSDVMNETCDGQNDLRPEQRDTYACPPSHLRNHPCDADQPVFFVSVPH